MKPSSSLSNDGSRLDERESHERQEQTDPSVPFLCAVPDSAARLEGTAASNRENEPVAQDYVLQLRMKPRGHSFRVTISQPGNWTVQCQ